MPEDHVYPLPRLTPGYERSPEVVRVCDKIRRRYGDDESYAEFYWFAREYPRCYRFHMDGARFRLESVHALLSGLFAEITQGLTATSSVGTEHACSNWRVNQVYWDFESFLSETSIALDLLARIIGPAFEIESPPSFSRLCKWPVSHPLVDLFRRAQAQWVSRLKDYRDCFTHYTPVDTLLTVNLTRFPDGWQFRAKLPVNPNVRDILGFRYSRRVDLLRYALSVQRRMLALDRAAARLLWGLSSSGRFPLRKDHLFFVGRRERR